MQTSTGSLFAAHSSFFLMQTALLPTVVFSSWTNVGDHAPLVAPDGGVEARFGTNPVTMGMPATGKNPAVILDMATSKVALGKVRVNFNKGVPMAEGSLIDGEGAPTNDPAVMFGATGTDGTVSDTPDSTRPRVSRRGVLSWTLVV